LDIRPGNVIGGPNGKDIKVEKLLGSGGFGQVFRGSLPDGTPVAVKTVLTAALSPPELAALQNEARLAKKIIHPNVVRVVHVDEGKTAGQPPYIVMEYVDGGSLRDTLKDRRSGQKPFDPSELRAMYVQIAAGMEAVNAILVHRDLKPENVLVGKTEQVLKIADFGLAKLADATTRSATFKGWGTPQYMSPEAFDLGPNTVAMDVYSAGILFHEMAALALPVIPKSGERGWPAWRLAHLLQPPTNIRTARADLPADLVQLIMAMLQKDPAKRPPSWLVILERLRSGTASPVGSADVSALVEQATARHREGIEGETRAREETERRQERLALLEQVFEEPLELFRQFVETYNAATTVGKIAWEREGPFSVFVKSVTTHRGLVLQGQIVEDLDIRLKGIVRMTGKVELTSSPALEEAQHFVPNSMSGFNLAYQVPRATDRFGTWAQFRFEFHPFTQLRGPANWFALGLAELPHQLQVLNGSTTYQHEQRALDDAWFRELVLKIL
jgi:hypothetical protein